MPCSLDLATQPPTATALSFTLTNEFEQSFTTLTTLAYWTEIPLTRISPAFGRDALGGQLAQTRVQPAGHGPGFLLTVQSFYAANADGTATSLPPVYAEGMQAGFDLISLPAKATGAVR